MRLDLSQKSEPIQIRHFDISKDGSVGERAKSLNGVLRRFAQIHLKRGNAQLKGDRKCLKESRIIIDNQDARVLRKSQMLPTSSVSSLFMSHQGPVFR